jgi:Uncharacterized protein conserved in bacteria (DUF2169)
MKLVNRSGLPAVLQNGSTGDREMLGVIACKATWSVDRGRLAEVSVEESWPVFEQPFEFEGVPLAHDIEFRRSGLDLLLFASAWAPHDRPVETLTVGIATGDFAHETVVVGDRTWLSSRSGLVASRPEPFVQMPLTNDRAYGGQAQHDGATMSHPLNPAGRGFYLSEEEAKGKPLPNIEWPEWRIQTWDDQPPPACWYKQPGAPSSIPTGVPDDQLAHSVLDEALRQSPPWLHTTLDIVGDSIRLTGIAPRGALVYPMPPLWGPSTFVEVGPHQLRVSSRLATLVVLAESDVLVGTYVSMFRWLFAPEQRRSVELDWPEASRG